MEAMEGRVDVKQMMEKIEIKSVTGRRLAVEVGVSETLRDLKQKVFALEEIDPGNQRFMFGSKCLVDNEVAVVDQMNAILAKRSSPLPWFTVWLLFKFRGGDEDGERPESPSSFSSEADLQGEEKEPFKLNGRRLQIHVISLTAREIPVEIMPTDTLRDLNQKILDIEKIPFNQQRLIFGDSQLIDGIVFDQVNAILARLPRLVDSIETHDSMPETVHVKMSLMLRLRGGGLNVIYHEGQRTWTSSDSDSDDNDENRRKGRARNTASHEGQGHRNLPPNASKGVRSGKQKKKKSGWFSWFKCRK